MTHKYSAEAEEWIPVKIEAVRSKDGVNIIDIAVQEDVGPNLPKVDLTKVGVKNYLRNPVVLWNHGRELNIGSVPIARSTKLTKHSSGRFTAHFEFLPNDDIAQRIKNAWDKGFIRAASIGVKNKAKGSGYPVDLQMTEWSLCAVPIDEEALRRSQSEMMQDFIFGAKPVTNNSQEGLDMDKDELTKVIQDAIKDSTTQRSEGDSELDTDKLASSMADKIGGLVEKSVEAAIEKHSKAKDDETKRAEEAEAEKKKLEDDVQNKVMERAEIISNARAYNLIPEDKVKELSTKSNEEILRSALGEENAEELKDKSEDYLKAKFDQEVATRSEATKRGFTKPVHKDPGKGGAPSSSAPSNIIDLKRRIKAGGKA